MMIVFCKTYKPEDYRSEADTINGIYLSITEVKESRPPTGFYDKIISWNTETQEDCDLYVSHQTGPDTYVWREYDGTDEDEDCY